MKTLFFVLIRLYQKLLSPFLGRHCRFFPSCSEYAEEALLGKSAPLALWLVIKRVLKCHPFHPGGYDPLES